MAETYYYMWEFVTSMTIIILVAAYIIHDRIRLRFEKLEEPQRQQKIKWLKGITMTILGVLAVIGGGSWVGFILTHKIYISEELAGFHDKVPGIIMVVIGLLVLFSGIKKYRHPDVPDANNNQ